MASNQAVAQSVSRLKKLWLKTGLTGPVIAMAVKGAIVPTVAIAMYQSAAVAETYTTVGYVIAIVSILCSCIVPRAKFLQTIVLSSLATGIGGAMAMLVTYCTTQARQHTTVLDSTSTYNSSASAVSAVWLFFNVWAANAIRVAYPNLNTPAIFYTLFLCATSTWGPQFLTVAAGASLVTKFLKSFLTGFALATGANLLLFPVSCRDVIFKETLSLLRNAQSTLKAYSEYMRDLNASDLVLVPRSCTPTKAIALEHNMQQLMMVHVKMQGDLAFAKRETSVGYLDADDLDKLCARTKAIFRPLLGISTVMNTLKKMDHEVHAECEETAMRTDGPYQTKQLKGTHLPAGEEAAKDLQIAVETLIEATIEGLEHTIFMLRLNQKSHQPKGANVVQNDTEQGHGRPGRENLVRRLEDELARFEQSHATATKTMVDPTKSTLHRTDDHYGTAESKPYLLLFTSHLFHCTAVETLALVKFADCKAADGTLTRRRLIHPGRPILQEWLSSITRDEDRDHLADILATNVRPGQSLPHQKDPDHLAPVTRWEKYSDVIVRAIPRALHSKSSNFGFRVACAIMTIAIADFLHDSQAFFIQHRGFWAETTVAMGMSGNTGQSMFAFSSRLAGTALAAIASLAIYYIPDGHTAGVIIFFWVFLFVAYTIILKQPQLAVASVISMTTLCTIIGYTLQVRSIGVEAATSSGQEYLPIYNLAPYRLLAITIGLASAFFWTIFPYPLTSKSLLREELGPAIFTLAKFNACVDTSIQTRLGNTNNKEPHPDTYEKVERSLEGLLLKSLHHQAELKKHSGYASFEPTIGGKFPKKRYAEVIEHVRSVTGYLGLIAYGARSFMQGSEKLTNRTFDTGIDPSAITSPQLTAILATLAGSIVGGNALPPGISAAVRKGSHTITRSLHRESQDVTKMTEPEYSALLVVQVSSQLLHKEVRELIESVRELVGEIEFSFDE